MAFTYYADDFIKSNLQKGKIVIATFPADCTAKYKYVGGNLNLTGKQMLRAIVRKELRKDGESVIETLYGLIPRHLCQFSVFDVAPDAIAYLNEF